MLKKFCNQTRRIIRIGRSPDFLIIGAQKSGTSTLHAYIDKHPKFNGSVPKEIHYFNQLINFGKSINWYEKHFIGKSEKHHFETTPSYFYSNSAPYLISRYYPNIKLIIILRNPVYRAFSAWNMYLDMYNSGRKINSWKDNKRGLSSSIYKYLIEPTESFPNFTDSINIELELIKNNVSTEPSILRRGIYIHQIERYLNYHKIGNMLVLGFKELVHDPEEVMIKILKFLDVKSDKRYIQKMDLRNVRNYNNDLLSSEIEFLEEYYKPYNESLFQMLGRELDW